MRGGKAADGTPPEHKKNGVIIWSEMQKILLQNTRKYIRICFDLHTLKNRHEAEDVVSETVLDAWKGIEGLKDENAFRAWIFRILANKCRQKLKSYLNRAVELPADLAWRERDTSEDMDVRAAFYKLNDEERLILSSSLFGGYTGKEIAAMLEMNENTVRSLKSRALKKMEQMLSE